MALGALIAIVVVVLVLAALGAWLLGYPINGFESFRAAVTEAGERVSDLTSDFADWVKLGG